MTRTIHARRTAGTRLSLSARLSGCLLALTPLTVPAQVAPPPDGGSLRRDLAPALRESAPPSQLAPPAAPPAAGGERFTVSRFDIDGATLVPAADVQAVLAPELGKPLTLAQLEDALQRIALLYRDRGYFARPFLPPQDVKGGRVRVTVLEGRLGKVQVESTATRVDSGYVARVVGRGQAPGQPLSAAALERGLLLANDLPGVDAEAILSAGARAGESDMLIKIRDGRAFEGSASVANTAGRATGNPMQLAAGGFWNTGNGSQYGLRGVFSQGLQLVLGSARLPLGTDGLRLNLSASALQYSLHREFKPLNARGQAQTVGAELGYPLVRTTEADLSLGAALEHRRYDDRSGGIQLHDKKVNAFQASLTGSRFDTLGGGGQTQGNLTFAAGRVDLSGVPADLAADAAGAGTQGGWQKLNLGLSRLQAVSPGWTVLAAFSAQLAGGNLDSSEKFALGGPTGVRGYPGGEGSGDEGRMLKLELRRSFSETLSASVFHDWGHTRRNKSPYAGSAAPNSYSLRAAGVGLTWLMPRSWALQATLARPLGGNPGEPAPGKNQDGSGRGTRAWLNLSTSF